MDDLREGVRQHARDACEGENVEFLTIEQVKWLHEEAIRRCSPKESLAIRDRGLLESAVMSPQATWGGAFLYSSVVEMAAAYLISLNQNHAFENGNKRVAFSACSTFLRMNGLRLTLSQNEAVGITLAIASHKMEREEAVALLEGAVEPL